MSEGTAVPAPSAALRHLEEVHGPVLTGYLTRLTGGDRRRAEEIGRETLRRAGQAPEARTAGGRWSRAWLFTTARALLAEQGGGTDPPDRERIRAAVDALPERLRITLVEIYFRERSTAEVAALLLVPTGTVEARTAAALRALRRAGREPPGVPQPFQPSPADRTSR